MRQRHFPKAEKVVRLSASDIAKTIGRTNGKYRRRSISFLLLTNELGKLLG
jgi:hypothetical protein